MVPRSGNERANLRTDRNINVLKIFSISSSGDYGVKTQKSKQNPSEKLVQKIEN
jgi:hypothetical protein